MSALPKPVTPKERFKLTDHWGWVEGLYLAGNDDGIALRLLWGEDYEPESRKLWRRLCSKADIALDIGAHTGVYSLDAWKAGAKEVISIEPFPVNYARLMMNLRHSGFNTSGVMMVAAGDENSRTVIGSGNPNFYCAAGIELGFCHPRMQAFPVIALRTDDLLKEPDHHRINVIKIDTEKTVGRVLTGMPDILSYKPDLILECIEDGLTEILKPLGYSFYRIHEKTGLHAVDRLSPDDPVDMQSPNRFATVRNL